MTDKALVPVESAVGAIQPMRAEEAVAATKQVEQIIKRMLVEDTDYGKIPGTLKPCMFKPGAEKLGWAFQLTADYDIIDKVEDRENGVFSYTVKCRLIHRVTGQLMATQLAEFSTREKNRTGTPANTALKMAQKRAYVGAMLNATFTSDRFTVDMEDYESPDRTTDEAQRSDGDRKPDAEMKSKFGSEKHPSKCAFCGKSHILEGDPVVLDKSVGEKAWGHRTCWFNMDAKDNSEDSSPPTNMGEAKHGRSYLQIARDGENKYCSLFSDDEQPALYNELLAQRKAILRIPLSGEPCDALDRASPGTLKAYVAWLSDAVKSTKTHSNK